MLCCRACALAVGHHGRASTSAMYGWSWGVALRGGAHIDAGCRKDAVHRHGRSSKARRTRGARQDEASETHEIKAQLVTSAKFCSQMCFW